MRMCSEVVMRILIGLGLVAMSSPCVMAQSPLSLKSTIETGWTSNATESVAGGADVFVQHRHEATVTGTLGMLSLRAGLNFEQTHFATLSGEDDLALGGGVEIGMAPGEGVSLRI